ncbi:MAG TPA: type VII secretion target [Mycobacteriales bacterium]|nr:type VII secretion target [Mycobacteriales bacterium]
MSLIRVDPDALKTLSREVSDGVGVAREVNKSHDAMAAHAAHAGHSGVAQGIADFLNDWSYGCGNLVEDADQLATLLRHAGAIYIDVDKEVAQANRPH